MADHDSPSCDPQAVLARRIQPRPSRGSRRAASNKLASVTSARVAGTGALGGDAGAPTRSERQSIRGRGRGAAASDACRRREEGG
eukprot:ctg_1223.g403